jgi:uncharacterized protein involved in exopolysaccharide biosynthesis
MDQQSNTVYSQDEISFRDLLMDVWRAKFIVLALSTTLALGGLAIGLLTDRQYEASVVLAPAEDESGAGSLGGLGALASQYSGLASLAGINLTGGSHKDESIAVLQSELLTERYIRDKNLLPVLYARKWDEATRKWKTNDPKQVPTLWKANRYFKDDIRKITDERKTGLIVLTIRWKDPKQAAQWANDLVALTNNYLRDKAIREAQRNISYLNEQAVKTNVIEVRKAVYSLLEQEINKEMLARGREEYALKVIDPAVAPERPSSAGPKLLALFGFVLGGVLTILGIFARRALAV